MALIAQPFRPPYSGIYYLRRRVPDDLKHIIGKTEIRRSLNTRNHQPAKAAFAVAYAESERLFNDVRQGICIEHHKPEGVVKALPTPLLPAHSTLRNAVSSASKLRSVHLHVG